MRRLRRLVQKRSLRWSEGVCVLEGPDLVRAALDSHAEFEALYVDSAATSSSLYSELMAVAHSHGVRVFALAPGVIERVARALTPQPVLAAVRLPLAPLESLDVARVVLVLHDVRDPGNAGTLIRSADAASLGGVVFTGQSVDPFNSKVLRASAGSIFHVNVAVSTLHESLAYFRNFGATSYATVVRGALSHREVDFTQASVVVLGNEAEGLDESTVALCDRSISILMGGKSESLNAGVAGSLIAFEALWQREDATSSHRTSSL
ncbi:MAG: TrmH family RNA methyltransferase [Acidimicrobiales bacterium]